MKAINRRSIKAIKNLKNCLLTFQKQTALHMAALKGHSETCKVLIECDASMDAYDEQGSNIFRNNL